MTTSASQPTLNAFRSLFRILDGGRVAAFITAGRPTEALKTYCDKGGCCSDVQVEQLTFGYPEDVCQIYYTTPPGSPGSPQRNPMKLVYTATQKPVAKGDQVQINGATVTVQDFPQPHKPASSGKVTVTHDDPAHSSTYFVSVIGAEWIEREDRDDTVTTKDQTIAALAARLGFSSLATTNSSGDFKEVPSWGVKTALEAAYEAGRLSAN